MMRIFIVPDEIGDWIDKWAEQEDQGGFQKKCAEIRKYEVPVGDWIAYQNLRRSLRDSKANATRILIGVLSADLPIEG